MQLLCHILPQATQNLNLLWCTWINPRLSVEAQLNRVCNYNWTPMVPPGKKVLIHDTPQKRQTWDFHGKEGWYIGTAPPYNRCYRIYVSETRESS